MSTTTAKPMELVLILEGEANTPELQKAMEDAGFHVYSNDGDYSDYEFEMTYEDADLDSERKSVNLHFTFDWDARTAYQTIGVNLGSGFDNELSVNDDGRCFVLQLKEEIGHNAGTTSSEMQSVLNNPDVMAHVYDASRNLSRLFRRS